MAGFEHVLKKLVEDRDYREMVIKDTHQLKKDHDLSAEELTLLMQVWVNSDATARLSIWNCATAAAASSDPGSGVSPDQDHPERTCTYPAGDHQAT